MGDAGISDPDVVVDFHEKLIQRLLESEQVLAVLEGQTGVIGVHVKDPDVAMRINIDGENTRIERVDGGEEELEDARITMRWDTALRFWQGSLDIMGALFTGKIKVSGVNMDPLFRLKSIISEAKQASREVAEELGLT